MVKALTIGRKLERLNWFDMSAQEAQEWCENEARQAGAPENLQNDRIGGMIMDNLPEWPGASAVYSKAYRVLEAMALRGHAKPPAGRMQGYVSDDMTRLIDALGNGDEEEIKGLLLINHVYKEI